MTGKLADGDTTVEWTEWVRRIIREHHRTLVRYSKRAGRPSRTFHHGDEEAAEAIIALMPTPE